MIRERRIEMKMTQKQLARKLIVDKSYISKIENRQIKNISLNLVLKLSSLLNLDILELINFLEIK